MNQTVDSRKYYPTALALYITYFVLGIAASIMGQYKQDFAAMWDAAVLADGSYAVSYTHLDVYKRQSPSRKKITRREPRP